MDTAQALEALSATRREIEDLKNYLIPPPQDEAEENQSEATLTDMALSAGLSAPATLPSTDDSNQPIS